MEEYKPNILMGDDYRDTKTCCTFTCTTFGYNWIALISAFTNNNAGCSAVSAPEWRQSQKRSSASA